MRLHQERKLEELESLPETKKATLTLELDLTEFQDQLETFRIVEAYEEEKRALLVESNISASRLRKFSSFSLFNSKQAEIAKSNPELNSTPNGKQIDGKSEVVLECVREHIM